MKALLPCILFVIQHGNKELKLKALQVVRNVLCQLLRREASPMAMQLPQHLLPILHEVRLLGEAEPCDGHPAMQGLHSLRCFLALASQPI